MTRQRRAAELRGQDLRSHVAAQIRGKLGFTNEELLKFGIAPRRKLQRRKPEDPPAPPGDSHGPRGPDHPEDGVEQ